MSPEPSQPSEPSEPSEPPEPSEPAAQPLASRRARVPSWALLLLAAFISVIGLTLALRGVRWVASRGEVTGRASWIWAAHDRRQPQAQAFLLARDFSLDGPDDPPARATLRALGDEQYVLYLNGKRIGGGEWAAGAKLDEYEVGPLLRRGGNRLLAELRSADGAGGFLASVVDAASGRALVTTDERWRVFRRYHLGLLRGWLPVDPFAPANGSTAATAPGSRWPWNGSSGTVGAASGAAAAAGARPGWVSAAGPGEAVVSWGRPPIGRWGRVAPGWPRPLFAELTAGRQPLPAVVETLYQPAPISGVAGDSSMVMFDFGREVTGYLALETGYEPGMDSDRVQAGPDRQRDALLWIGRRPPAPLGLGSRVEPSGTVVILAGARNWLDSRLHRFRYALVLGLDRPLTASVYPVDEAVVARYRLAVERGGSDPPAARRSGVFSLTPPRLRTPVEDEIRRKLKRLPGVAGRKEL